MAHHRSREASGIHTIAPAERRPTIAGSEEVAEFERTALTHSCREVAERIAAAIALSHRRKNVIHEKPREVFIVRLYVVI